MIRYESYSSTGVKWLGAIPTTWECKKIGSLFSERKTKVSDKDYIPLSVAKIGVVPQLETAVKTDAGDNRKLVCAGDFVINSRSDRKGSCGVSELNGSVSLINIVLKPRQAWNNRYVHYLLRSPIFSEEFYRYGRGIVADLWTTRYSEMKNIFLPVPPRPEQDQIVRYLDWQVSKINKLIAAKKKEIAILKEYKERRVTEKLSGKNVWLKRLLIKPLQYGANSSGTAYDPNLPRYIRITDIDLEGNLKKEGAKSLSEEAEPYILEDGDILLARSGATVGKAFLYKRKFGLSAYAGYLIRAQFDKVRLLPEYFMYFTNSSAYQDWKDSVFIQATIQNISADKYGRLPIPLPSIEEQKQIVGELNAICKNIDSLIEIRHEEIRKVQELKDKLISDVVTGQIDVRGIDVPDFEYVEEESEDSSAADDEQTEELNDEE